MNLPTKPVPTPPDRWRVGRRAGQHLWQIKEGPGWNVRAEVATLTEAAAWLRAKGVDTKSVSVPTNEKWRFLDEHVAEEMQLTLFSSP
jgi:hypothetical protein